MCSALTNWQQNCIAGTVVQECNLPQETARCSEGGEVGGGCCSGMVGKERKSSELLIKQLS